MINKGNAEKLSKKMTEIIKTGQRHHIIVKDKIMSPFLRLPVLLFVVLTLILPIFVGIGLVLFLINDYHADVLKLEEVNKE